MSNCKQGDPVLMVNANGQLPELRAAVESGELLSTSTTHICTIQKREKQTVVALVSKAPDGKQVLTTMPLRSLQLAAMFFTSQHGNELV